jgi:hypothetical protein
MNWEQKVAALMALSSDVSIRMRAPGNWYISVRGVERKEGAMLSSGCVSEALPDKAVEAYWEWATDERYYLVIRAMGEMRRTVKWNGFMWADFKEER